jgi:hypothetical protein
MAGKKLLTYRSYENHENLLAFMGSYNKRPFIQQDELLAANSSIVYRVRVLWMEATGRRRWASWEREAAASATATASEKIPRPLHMFQIFCHIAVTQSLHILLVLAFDVRIQL